MARIRTIKPDFFRHEALYDAECKTGLPLRVAFAGIWTAADREGRFAWKPRALKLDCLPYDDLDFGAVLNALNEGGFIVRYEVGGEVYGHVPSWKTHQHINLREAASAIPAPGETALSPGKSGKGKHVHARASTPKVHGTHSAVELPPNGEEVGGTPPLSTPLAPPSEQGVLEEAPDFGSNPGKFHKGSEVHVHAPDDTSGEGKGREGNRKEKKETNIVGTGASPAPTRRVIDYPQEFEEGFWKPYPTNQNMPKFEALKSWLKLKKAGALPDVAEMQRAIAGYRNFLADASRKRGSQFPAAHATTWLNQRRFDEYLDAPSTQSGSTTVPSGAGWEAAFPQTWGALRSELFETVKTDQAWANLLADCRALSDTELVCPTPFHRDSLQRKFGEDGEKLAHIFKAPVQFRFERPTARH